MRGHLAVLLLALTALAGCSGERATEDGLRLADGSTLALDGEGTTDTLGAIAGVVVDEAIRPVPGAVLATPDGRNATSDDNGVFRLGLLEPGFYALAARATGFLTMQASVEVVAGETATLKVQLVRDIRPQPYLVTYPYDAYMQVWGTIAQWVVEIIVPTPLCDCTYSFTPEANATGIVLEAFWDSTTPDPAGLSEFYWEIGDPELDWYETGYCTNPCRVQPSMEGFNQGLTLSVRISGPDAWVAYQQQVHLFSTVFHNGPVPDGWTIGTPPS
ncbi:MAG: carboxypeptidase-like regulatory domain-containing protein [Candidatus Thermoplasmatota archaeon]